MKQVKTQDTTCGIYNTEYRLTCHQDGSVTIKFPYVKWTGSSGVLAFENVHMRSNRADEVKKAFNSGTVSFDLFY